MSVGDRIKGLVARARGLARPGDAERELDEEVEFHLEMQTRENIARGMSPDEARRSAVAVFGGIDATREAHRDGRGLRWLADAASDARYALRALRRAPVLSIAAIITLALGVGANAAIFSAVNAVILRPLPVRAPDELVMLWEENPEKGWHEGVAAPANVLDWTAQVAAFKEVASYNPAVGSRTITGDGAPPLLVPSMIVSGNFFDVLGVRPRLGRAFRAEESWATTGNPRTAIISDRLWHERFAGDPSIVGRTVMMDGAPTQVVGVMPAGWSFPVEGIDIWVPHSWKPESVSQVWFRRAHWLRPIARLKPGVSVEQANAQLRAVAKRLEAKYPETNHLMGAGLTPLHRFLVGDTRQPLLVLLGAVALLLLIACANVGNLMLVQAAGRERESALRLALGAGRGRLVRQAMTESVILSLLGGAAGAALGLAGTRAMEALQPAHLLRVSHFAFDWTVLAFVLAIATATGLLFGIAPAVWHGKQDPAESLKAGGRGASDGRRLRRWGDALVVGEVALALMLSVGAGLLVRSFERLQRVDPGFDPRGVLATSFDLPDAKYPSAEPARAFYETLLARVRAIPGVEAAAVASTVPLTSTTWSSDFTVQGWSADTYGTEVWHRSITPDYFRAMHGVVLRGRAFTDDDRAKSAPVVIVNDALVKRYFPGIDPIGKRIAYDKVPDSTTTWRTIVGIVKSEHQRALGEPPRIEVYEPMVQSPSSAMVLVVRGSSPDAATLAPAVRRAIAELDPQLALSWIKPMTEVVATSLARQRFLASLLAVFAGVGLALAVVGVYGVIAQLVRRRVREMGIRIALGAQAGDVRWLVVHQGLSLVVAGTVIGIGAGLVATRAMRTMLFDVEPGDPGTFIAVALLLVATGVLAAWIPATQASRADPATALRAD